MVHCFSHATARLDDLVRLQLQAHCGHLHPRRIVVKPNWVMHQREAAHPIGALVTDGRVIAAVVTACAELFPDCGQITVGDCPLQSADWPMLCEQSGLTAAMAGLYARCGDRLRFLDLRRDVYRVGPGGTFIPDDETPHGDPAGYREVRLGATSHLEAISDQAERFSILDHDAAVTRNSHRPGDHRYLVSQTVLDADLLINLPKWKTHSKAGMTGALKNMVGISADKAYLPHFRRGAPRWGGDEYADRGRRVLWLRNAVKNLVWRRSAIGYMLLSPVWRLIKHGLRVVSVVGGSREAEPFGSGGGGAWYGNQTIWRMIYDLNLIVRQVDAQGRLHAGPQRHYFCIVDGLVGGEGEGPLKPHPRPLDRIVIGDDPFQVDATLAWMMGFDPRRIPLLAQHGTFLGCNWGAATLEEVTVDVDGRVDRLFDVPDNFGFEPALGWRNQIERSQGIRAGDGSSSQP